MGKADLWITNVDSKKVQTLVSTLLWKIQERLWETENPAH